MIAAVEVETSLKQAPAHTESTSFLTQLQGCSPAGGLGHPHTCDIAICLSISSL